MTSQPVIIVAGSGRSGTTWVQDAIAKAIGYRTVFEPLSPSSGMVAREYANRYLAATADEPDLREFMDRVFRGELRTVWTRYRIVPERLVPSIRTVTSVREAAVMYRRYQRLIKNVLTLRVSNPKGLVVKFIRANLLLGWLRRNYDFPTLLVVRHPCAVIESQQRLDRQARSAGLRQGSDDWNPYPLLDRYLGDESLRRDLLDAYGINFKERNLTSVEAQTLIWIIENVFPLKQAAQYDIAVACYEDLVVGGVEAWCQVARLLGLPEEVFQANQLTKPSQQASEDFRTAGSGQEKISRWQERMSREDKTVVQGLLDRFGVTIYSAFAAMPIGSSGYGLTTNTEVKNIAFAGRVGCGAVEKVGG